MIVDDHPVVRQGLKMLIDVEDDLDVVYESEGTGEEIRIIRDYSPDLIIIDLSLGKISGLELIKDLKIRYPKLPTLVFSMHDELLYAERALRAGAKGYVMKQAPTGDIVDAIRKVVRGGVAVSEKVTSRMLHKLVGGKVEMSGSPVDTLTDRELEVFRLIGNGIGTRNIAEKLKVSIKTVESHRAHIKKKLRLDTATELLQHAVHWVQSQNGI